MNLAYARAFRDAAIADEWEAKPLYEGGEIEQAVQLTRDEWVIHIYLRSETDCGVSIWGPDRLAVYYPDSEPYDFEELERRLYICSVCGAEGETVRLGFAGRVCPACRKELAPTVEFRGWAD